MHNVPQSINFPQKAEPPSLIVCVQKLAFVVPNFGQGRSAALSRSVPPAVTGLGFPSAWMHTSPQDFRQLI